MKRLLKTYIGNLFLSHRFYVVLAVIAAIFLIRFFVEELTIIPWIALIAGIVIILVDYFMLFFSARGNVDGERACPARFSNGDENSVSIIVKNNYAFTITAFVIDEIPFQFQKRDTHFLKQVHAGETEKITYFLRPVKRGSYDFGKTRIYVMSPFRLLQRRFVTAEPMEIKVYPSFLQLRKYQLMAETNRWSDAGIRRRRRLGHSMEFEQIKEYVAGDDYRTVNWRATAHTGKLMVNNYTEEKSQQIYCVIDKGRAMKMPFEGLSLLDYAINASLVLSNVALNKQDKAGILTFSERIGSLLPADRRKSQMQAILETLYNQKTRYLESDLERLYITVRKKITQRSLLVLFTNFETLSALQRQLPYLRKIARYHLLLVIFFENTELKQLVDNPAKDVEEIYTKIIAEKFAYEKKLIVKELHQAGIAAILTAPKNVTVNTLNKYLELKARGAI